jgi:hypothetical protein
VGSNPAEAVGFFGRNLSMFSFGREVKPAVACRRFAARKRTLFYYVEVGPQVKLFGHFSLEVPSFSNRGLGDRTARGSTGLHARVAWTPLELTEATQRRGVQRTSIIRSRCLRGYPAAYPYIYLPGPRTPILWMFSVLNRFSSSDRLL